MSKILTISGNYFDLLDPHNSEFTIGDIAHALSNICRFNGHCLDFYSVAQHSVLVSHLVPKEYALRALLHDAAEAFIGDMTSPLKALIPDYHDIEYEIQGVIYQRFGLGWICPTECIKHADLVALATERKYLMVSNDDESPWDFLKGVKPLTLRPFKCRSPDTAAEEFLDRYQQIIDSGVEQL